MSINFLTKEAKKIRKKNVFFLAIKRKNEKYKNFCFAIVDKEPTNVS